MAIKSKKVKLTSRERTMARLRKKISGSDLKPRLIVFRTSRNIFVQIISDDSNKTLVSASTLESVVLEKAKTFVDVSFPNDSRSSKSVSAAMATGLIIAERAKAAGINDIVFDRNGFLYHGRIKAVADGARLGGLNF